MNPSVVGVLIILRFVFQTPFLGKAATVVMALKVAPNTTHQIGLGGT